MKYSINNIKLKYDSTKINKIIIYGCETWSLTLREEHGLKEFEKVSRGIFGPKREQITGGWRKLHNEELHHYNCNDQVKED
jgi:hypothetical protein